jgi:hypothetical protein
LQNFRVFGHIQRHKEFDREVNIGPAINEVGIRIPGGFESLPHGDVMDAPSIFPELQTAKEIRSEEGNLRFTHWSLDGGSTSTKVGSHVFGNSRVQDHHLVLWRPGNAERI